MPYKGGVQLLPETARRPTLRSYTSGNSYFYAGAVLGLVVVVIGAILGGYKANLNDRMAALDGQLDATEKTRNKQHEQILLDLAKQSRVMKGLFSSKIYWTQAFGYVEKMMQSGVRLTSLTANATKGSIGFHAVTNSYASVAHQIAAFVAGTGVEDITIKAITTNQQGQIEFDGEMTIDTHIMLNKSSK